MVLLLLLRRRRRRGGRGRRIVSVTQRMMLSKERSGHKKMAKLQLVLEGLHREKVFVYAVGEREVVWNGKRMRSERPRRRR
jgi:hypothetical protein